MCNETTWRNFKLLGHLVLLQETVTWQKNFIISELDFLAKCQVSSKLTDYTNDFLGWKTFSRRKKISFLDHDRHQKCPMTVSMHLERQFMKKKKNKNTFKLLEHVKNISLVFVSIKPCGAHTRKKKWLYFEIVGSKNPGNETPTHKTDKLFVRQGKENVKEKINILLKNDFVFRIHF